PGEQGARGVDVCHDMHVPTLSPGRVGSLGPTPKGDAGVGAVDIDPAISLERSTNETRPLRLDGDVSGNSRATNLRRDRLRGLGIDVGDHHMPGPIGGEAPAEGAANATAASGHDHDAIANLHRQPSTEMPWSMNPRMVSVRSS